MRSLPFARISSGRHTFSGMHAAWERLLMTTLQVAMRIPPAPSMWRLYTAVQSGGFVACRLQVPFSLWQMGESFQDPRKRAKRVIGYISSAGLLKFV